MFLTMFLIIAFLLPFCNGDYIINFNVFTFIYFPAYCSNQVEKYSICLCSVSTHNSSAPFNAKVLEFQMKIFGILSINESYKRSDNTNPINILRFSRLF